MGKMRGHHTYHRRGHHRNFGFGFGMDGPPGHFVPNGSPFEQRDPGQSDLGNPHINPRNDPRMGFSMRGRGCSMRGRGFHHMLGRHFGWPSFYGSTSSSDSSSDSDTKCKSKSKKGKHHHFKHWNQMHDMMSDHNSNKVVCTLCCARIQPLAKTEVLECGHLYHRLCLKELFTVSQREGKTEIFCTQCRQQIDSDLVTQLKNRFNDETNTGNQTQTETPTQMTTSFEMIQEIENN